MNLSQSVIDKDAPILVVDDMEFNCLAARLIIERNAGVDVDEAYSA